MPREHRPHPIDVQMEGSFELRINWVADRKIQAGEQVTIVWPVHLSMINKNDQQIAEAVRELSRLTTNAR